MPSIVKAIPFVLIVLASHLSSQEAAPIPADTLFQNAVTQLRQGKYQDAEASFRKLSEVEPTTSRGILGVATVWRAQKRVDEALHLLQEEAAKYPTRADLHFGMGNLALGSAKYDLAIAEFQLVLDSVDRNSKGAADLYLRLGEAYRLKGDVDFAVTVLQQAQTLQPTNVVILNTLAFTLESAGKKQPAADSYRKILEIDPKHGIAANNLAFILADTDAPLALAYALRARQLLPNEPTIIDTLGWVYLNLKRADDAIPLFRDVVQKNPGNATYRYHLAAALEMKGSHTEARQESEAALKSNPSKDDEQRINELLRTIRR